jgi:hypothetical protein
MVDIRSPGRYENRRVRRRSLVVVVLVIMVGFLCVPEAESATTLFSDGFESGSFSAWSPVRTGGGGTATVQTTRLRTGTYAARLTALGTGGSYAYVRKSLAASRLDVTAAGDFYIESEGASGGNVPLLRLYNSAGTRLASLYRQNGTYNRLWLEHSGTYASTAGTMTRAQWARAELRLVTAGTGTSTAEVRLNGALVYQTTTASFGASGAATLQVGNDTQNQTFVLYADNVSLTEPGAADTTPPETTITGGPSGNVASSDTTFTFSSSEPGSTFACRLDGAAWAPCSSPKIHTGLPDGAHTFETRATDPAGNTDVTPALRTWTVATGTSATLFWDGFEGGSFSAWSLLRTGGGGTAGVQTTRARTGSRAARLSALGSGGSYAYARKSLTASRTDVTVTGDFYVESEGASGGNVPLLRLYNGAGTRLATLYRQNGTSNRLWLEHSGTYTSTAGTLTKGRWARVEVRLVTAGTGLSTAEVRLDGALVYQTMTASLGTSGVATVQIGNDTQNQAFVLYADNVTVTEPAGPDTAPPETVITDGPVGLHNAPATFVFTASEASSTFACRVDGADWAGCASPMIYAALDDGLRTFEVRATDPAGNTDASPAVRTWTVDTTPPDTAVESGPSGTAASPDATFTFSATEPGGFECRLNGGPWQTCLSPFSVTALDDGEHSVEVRALDVAGNRDPAPAVATWTIDAPGPNTIVDAAPAGTVNTPDVSIAFSASEDGASFECRLDGAPWEPCTSPALLVGLADGAHTYEVRAADAGGLADPTPVVARWVLDTLAPDTIAQRVSPDVRSGPLHSMPTQAFVDANGHEVRLNGLNVIPVWSNRPGQTWEPERYEQIRAKGFNAVRFVLYWDDYEPTRGSFNQTHLRTLDAAIGMAKNAGLYVILDAIHLWGSGGFNDVPAWARTGDSVTTVQTNGGGYLKMLAGRYRAEPAVAGYDLVNEFQRSPLDQNAVLRAYDSLITEVRTVDPDKIVILEPTIGDTSVAPGIADFANLSHRHNVVWSLHDYFAGGDDDGYKLDGTKAGISVWNGTSGYTTPNLAQLEAHLLVHLDATRAAGIPMWIGEFGIGAGVANRDLWIDHQISLFERYGLGRAWWEYSSSSPLSAINRADYTWKPWVDRLLPFSATANTPDATFSFSANEPGTRFECRTDGGLWEPFTPPARVLDLPDGPHTFEVRAIDAAGNVDATPAFVSWAVATSTGSAP